MRLFRAFLCNLFAPPPKPRSRLMFWDIHQPSPCLMLEIELRGRLRRRHLPTEQWQRDCIRLVIDRLRRARKMR